MPQYRRSARVRPEFDDEFELEFDEEFELEFELEFDEEFELEFELELPAEAAGASAAPAIRAATPKAPVVRLRELLEVVMSPGSPGAVRPR